jgi:hypothetical protein
LLALFSLFRSIEKSSGRILSSQYAILSTEQWVNHSSQTEWNLIFALIRSTISHPEAARLSFDLITGLASDGPEQLVTADNFSGLITVLDDFATTAGTSTESQQHQGRRHEPLTSSK